jgi:TPR repeat protein
MEQEIIAVVENYDWIFERIDNDNDLKIIHECLIENVINDIDINNSAIVLVYYGFYYEVIKKDYERMKFYYEMAVEKGSRDAMFNLGLYYDKQQIYDMMLKYYLMAIEKGDLDAMYNLGLYYEELVDYDNSIKYYSMAAGKADTDAMYALAGIFQIQNNYKISMKYFLKGAKHGNSKCTDEVNKYIKTHPDISVMSVAYNFLTTENKETLNKMIKDVYSINNIDIINETICIKCQQVLKCIFMMCGHSMCINCYGNKCTLCI